MTYKTCLSVCQGRAGPQDVRCSVLPLWAPVGPTLSLGVTRNPWLKGKWEQGY